jgi:hypothetical protein
MKRILLALSFFVALVAIWAAFVRSVILNEVKDLPATLLITVVPPAWPAASVVRSLASLGMTTLYK